MDDDLYQADLRIASMSDRIKQLRESCEINRLRAVKAELKLIELGTIIEEMIND